MDFIQFRAYLTTVFIIVIGVDCAKNKINDPKVEPRLRIAPDTLRLSSIHLEDTITISSADQHEINWRVVSKPNWITLTSMAGSVSDTPIQSIVTVDPGSLFTGTYRADITFTGEPGGNESILCYMTVLDHSDALVDIDTLKLGAPLFTASFQLYNLGNHILEWASSSSVGRVSLDPPTGQVEPKDSTLVTVTFDPTRLAAGTYNESIRITSNSISGEISIPIEITFDDFTRFHLSTEHLKFDFMTNSLRFEITNLGSTTSRWQLNTDDSLLTISPSSGTAASGETVSLRVDFDRGTLKTDTLYSTIILTANDTIRDTINVEEWTFRSDIWWLNFEIASFEFNPVRNIALAAELGSYTLRSLNMESHGILEHELTKSPSCLSISPDGTTAVVGHDGGITKVDLTQGSQPQFYDVSTIAYNIVMGRRNWAYVMPENGQWTYIYSIDLTTGEEYQSRIVVREATQMRLHSSGDYIYGLSRYIYPNDFEKYDISHDTAVVMYDSPYHGTYDLGLKFWISGDGERLYTETGCAFTTSPDPAYDMLYRGSMVGISEIRSLTQSNSRSLIAVIGSNETYPDKFDRIYLYNTNSLTLRQIVILPPQIKMDEFSNWRRIFPEGQYVFFDPQGDKLNVVLNGYAPDGTTRWGILTIDPDEE